MLPLLRVNCAEGSCPVCSERAVKQCCLFCRAWLSEEAQWATGAPKALPPLPRGWGSPVTPFTAKPARIHCSSKVFMEYDLVSLKKIYCITPAALSSAIAFINLSEWITQVCTRFFFNKAIVFVDCGHRTLQMLSNISSTIH